MTRDEAYAALLQLAEEGWLLGVDIFGADDCCEHGPHTDCPANGYGLGDTQNAMSDCNRAEKWLMRPRNSLMTQDLADVLSDEDIGWDQHSDEPAPAPGDPLPYGDQRRHIGLTDPASVPPRFRPEEA